MNRITERTDNEEILLSCEQSLALKKLASYEDAHEAVLKEYDRVSEQINQAKAQGRMRGVTANQLIAQKMSLQNVLSYFKRFGVDD